MPQMAPLNWLTLFIYFVMIFFIHNVLNYFSFMYKIKSFESNKSLINLFWKW
uniref:ATP synthase complex subunit 8 n=1 Tax=Epuraea sp. TaxID=2789194 RepID=A0A8F0HXX4_9CUCU|nr:ATP synthase F0 subunit 8 [Epuraea sp.]